MRVLNKYKKECRFLVVGGCSTLIDFIIYMFLSRTIGVTLSKLISMLCATVFSFIFNKSWTFSVTEKVNENMVIKYIISQVINILCNTLMNTFVYFLTKVKILSFAVATCFAMIINFLLQKKLVFKEKEK